MRLRCWNVAGAEPGGNRSPTIPRRTGVLALNWATCLSLCFGGSGYILLHSVLHKMLDCFSLTHVHAQTALKQFHSCHLTPSMLKQMHGGAANRGFLNEVWQESTAGLVACRAVCTICCASLLAHLEVMYFSRRSCVQGCEDVHTVTATVALAPPRFHLGPSASSSSKQACLCL